LIVFALHVKMT